MELLKSIKKNTIILLAITVAVLFIVLKNDFNNIIHALSNMDYIYIIIAIVFFFLSVFFHGYVNYILVANPQQLSIKEAFKHNVITQFFNGITPFSTGGQPMEVYMLTEHNIKTTKATGIIIQSFIFYQTALVIYGLLAVSYNYIFHIFPKVPVLRKLVLLGFFVNVLVVVALYIICYSPKLTRKVMHGLLSLLHKMKIVKDKDATKEKWQEKLNEFHESAKELNNRKGIYTKGITLNLLSLTFLYIIPLFIMYALHNYNSLNICDTLASSSYVMIIGAFVPIPGATGGIEYGFLRFFGNFIGQKIISAVLLVWRFITYYLGMIIGAVVFSLEKKGD